MGVRGGGRAPLPLRGAEDGVQLSPSPCPEETEIGLGGSWSGTVPSRRSYTVRSVEEHEEFVIWIPIKHKHPLSRCGNGRHGIRIATFVNAESWRSGALYNLSQPLRSKGKQIRCSTRSSLNLVEHLWYRQAYPACNWWFGADHDGKLHVVGLVRI